MLLLLCGTVCGLRMARHSVFVVHDSVGCLVQPAYCCGGVLLRLDAGRRRVRAQQSSALTLLTRSLGRRALRAVGNGLTGAPAIARTTRSGAHEPYLYRFRRQARRHPSLAHEVCLACLVCLTIYHI